MNKIIAGLSNSRLAALLMIAVVVSVALNVGLAYRLRSIIDAQDAQFEAKRLKQGAAVPPLNARRVDEGIVETIGYADVDRPTVLYVLSPHCGWCTKNENSIRRLIADRRDKYRFIGISLVEEGAQDYAVNHDLGIPLYTGLSDDMKEAYKMRGTPQTIVVSPSGVVVANWNGAYLGKQKDAVEEFFKVRLPEIDLKGKAAH